MTTAVAIREFAAHLERELGFDPEKALRYADWIGDDPQLDEDGLVIVRNAQLEIIDRIAIPGL